MAIVNNKTETTSNFKKADAFLRMSVVDKEGNRIKLPKDLPMHVENRVMRSMINAAKQGLEAGKEVEFTITATVFIPTEESDKDIEF